MTPTVLSGAPLVWAAVFAASYLLGSVPFAYIIVKWRTGEDITTHGTGNVGAMNVRRTTGSWAWFTVAMVSDALKGILPVVGTKYLSGMAILVPFGVSLQDGSFLSNPLPPLALIGAVLGHNYSLWMALIEHRFARTGKGLATGAGALLVYDWRYFVAALAVGLIVIAVSRYLMAGQVAAAMSLPIASFVLRSPDWPFALLAGLLVYAAHHKRFVGLLRGKEPRLYVDDSMGPRG
jgi:acyl phosphate:glycerol-3-phosphate acyltransferase